MSISEHTLKLLWGDAASCCAICKRMLTEDSSPTRRTVLGEAAHIVARSPKGPRGAGPRPTDIDGYDNLILLCPDDHKVIDDRPSEFTITWLMERKQLHRAWVTAALRGSETLTDEPSDSGEQRLLRGYGPSNWLCPPSANGPEIFVRVAVALPAPMPLRFDQPVETASLLEPEDREDVILNALDGAVLTRELRDLRGSWHWTGDSGWHIQGGAAGPEVTTAAFAFQWATPRLRQPLGLRCSTLTGWTGGPGWQRALLVSLDLSLNVLELNHERLPADIRHHSTPVPVPAALQPDELGELISLLASEVGPIGTDILGALTGLQPETAGAVAAWMQHDGIALNRFVDLTGWTRLPNPSSATRAEAAEPWPFAHDDHPGERRLARKLLADALQRNDYRRYRKTLDRMFGSA